MKLNRVKIKKKLQPIPNRRNIDPGILSVNNTFYTIPHNLINDVSTLDKKQVTTFIPPDKP